MTTDIAKLSIAVDSTSARTAASDLERLGVAGNAAKGSNGERRAIKAYAFRAAQGCKVNLIIEMVRLTAYVKTRWNVLVYSRVQPPQINAAVIEQNGLHAATYVNADEVWDDLVRNRHGRADGTSHTGVRVRHDADFTAGNESMAQKMLHLLDGRRLGSVGEHFGYVVFTLKFDHFFRFKVKLL